MKEIKRVSAGVVFESDVLTFINQLALSQQRNRSFIINSIIRYYAKLMQSPQSPTEATPIPKPNPVEVVQAINF